MPSLMPRRRGRPTALPLSTAALLLLLLASTLVAGSAQAADTGTITGKVVDESGVPLQNASVILFGKGLGGPTNADGKFVLAKVPVGVYTVRAMMAGKQRSEKSVTVDANRTVVVDFQLGVEAFKIKEVEVKADKKMAIRKDAATS